ncbi:baseplate J/gp47 family protein [Paenibacillus caseinilyticus]|uniref:baseplate J/gp47 family protein n=1 Tax=Paenibacillus caseinilyticus TaxID=3098138 RepID=UPI0022B895A8|nr:baseplate J/gp47 family protein [Paenibacillus caseinilyticus]MCZ8518893.1 baseplate J/gp47 family protein [Paenibacillus caseinilyticus]
MLDEKGFKRPRFADLFSDMESKAREAYGEQINTSERSPLGIILRLFAWFLAILWQGLEAVYNSAFPDTATGVSLYRLGPFGGIQRLQASRAIGSITITGTAGSTVASGFRVKTTSNVVFETLEAVTLDGTGHGTANIQALLAGKTGNVAAGQITTIVNPVAHVTAVINQSETSGGREEETAQEFRNRFGVSAEGRGKATIPAIRAALLRTTGVRAATVIENFTNTTDAAGRPPKSFEAFVLGGLPQDIGQAILDTKAGGIQPWGTESVTVKDDSGTDRVMRFSYAVEVPVHQRITVTTDNRFPANGAAQVETAAIRYVGGEDADGTVYVGLSMGAEVVHSRIIAAAYSVEGVIDVKVELSTDGTSWQEGNLQIDANEVAQTAANLVTVVPVV